MSNATETLAGQPVKYEVCRFSRRIPCENEATAIYEAIEASKRNPGVWVVLRDDTEIIHRYMLGRQVSTGGEYLLPGGMGN